MRVGMRRSASVAASTSSQNSRTYLRIKGIPKPSPRQGGYAFRAGRFFKGAERIEVGVLVVGIVDREIDSTVPEALQRLAQVQDAAFAVAVDVFEVDLQGNKLLAAARLVEHRAFGAAHDRTPVAAVADAVDVEDEALVGDGRGPRDTELDVPVYRARQGGTQDHLSPHHG